MFLLPICLSVCLSTHLRACVSVCPLVSLHFSIWLYVYCVCTMFMCLYYVYHLTTGLLDSDAGRLARSQNPEGPATGHLDPGFLGFPGS